MQKPRLEFRYTAMKVLWVFVLAISCGHAFGQNVTFKKRFDNGLDNYGLGVLETDSGYIMYGRGLSATQRQNGVSIKFFKTDLQGNITAFKEFGSQDANWQAGFGNSGVATYDGNYMLAGTRVFSAGHQGILIKFDSNLDTLWTRSFPSSRDISLYQCRETADKGFILVGADNAIDPFSNITLIRTDSLGNELWHREYGGPYRDIGWTVELTPDGGFIIGGDSYQDGALDSRGGIIIKVDSAGNVEWEKLIGSGLDDGVFNVNTYSDSGYIAWGNLDTLNRQVPMAYVSKLDSEGNLVWKSLFFEHEIAFVAQCTELANGNILAVGNVRLDTLPGPFAWLALHDNGGNKLWEKYYYWNVDTLLGMRINDFIETSDGGILVTGAAQRLESDGSIREQFLLMKLDSNGCLINDCGLFTGIEEYFPPNETTVSVYPNPASNYLTISYTSNHNLAVKPKAIIYNLQGQVLQEVVLQSNSGQEQISVAGYASGMYLYQVVSGGQVLGSGKVVVE